MNGTPIGFNHLNTGGEPILLNLFRLGDIIYFEH